MKKITVLNYFYIVGIMIMFVIDLVLIKGDFWAFIIVSLTTSFLILYPFIRKKILQRNMKERNYEFADVYRIYDALLSLEKQYEKCKSELENEEKNLRKKKKEFEEQKKYTNETVKFIEKELTKISKEMPGESYERFVGFCLITRGWKIIKYTKRSGDYGADIIARNPDGIKTSIQCKRYKKNVGIDAVQQVYASERYYNCNNGVVITNSKFTQPAHTLAKKTNVILWENFPKKEIDDFDIKY